MSWLDNVVAWISPEAGAKRAAWRATYNELRNYDAGNNSRLNAGWRAANYSAEMTDRTSRDTIRARARDLERNSDIANSLISAYKRNVIGAGYNLQAKTKNAKLNADIEKLWKKWCKARNCDVTGTQTLNQILRMAVTRKKVDGGILFVKVYTNDGMIPFKLQMIEVDELDTLQVGETAGGNRIVGGIEYNKYNRPVAYWIRQYGIDGFSLEKPRRIDANDVIFYYTKRRPSQIREMSDMSQTATRIRDTNEFMTAVSVKERIAACLSVFIKKQLPTVGIGRNAATENVGKHEYDGKTLTPGMIKELNAGDEVQVVNPTGQGSDATSFTKLQQRMIGAGQGLSYEATSRDMSETNYASARQGAIEDEMTYQEEVEAILAILDEIYETFVISCYLAGLIKVNKDFWTKKDDYLEHGWIKSPKKWIDPLKESSANKIALNTGQKTYKEIAAENGRDWKQQIDDNLEVIEYAKKKGYDLGGVIFDGKLGSEKEEEQKPEPPKPDDQTGDGQEEGTNDDDKGTQSGDGKEGQSASGEGQE